MGVLLQNYLSLCSGEELFGVNWNCGHTNLWAMELVIKYNLYGIWAEVGKCLAKQSLQENLKKLQELWII